MVLGGPGAWGGSGQWGSSPVDFASAQFNTDGSVHLLAVKTPSSYWLLDQDTGKWSNNVTFKKNTDGTYSAVAWTNASYGGQVWVYQNGSWGPGAWGGSGQWGNSSVDSVSTTFDASGNVTTMTVVTGQGTWYFDGKTWQKI